MDEAFCFYYEDNLKLLEKLGAELIYFSPLHDNMLPADINGCILGGGYPELYLDGLSNNTSMLKSINHAFTTLQMPYIAECGGFLYLHENMEDTNHHNYKLAGVIQADALYKKHLQHFGYINLSPADNTTGKKREIKAHEFHYYDSTDNGSCFIAQKPLGIPAGTAYTRTDKALLAFHTFIFIQIQAMHADLYKNAWTIPYYVKIPDAFFPQTCPCRTQ